MCYDVLLVNKAWGTQWSVERSGLEHVSYIVREREPGERMQDEVS